MKLKNLAILIILLFNSSICLAVPVGNNLELIPAPRNLGININQASQKLTVNGAIALTNFLNNPSTISSQPTVFVKGNGLYYTSPLHSNPFRLDTNISNGGSLINPTLSGNVNFSSAILSPFTVAGAIQANVFNGGTFKGDGSLLTGIVPSSLKAPDGSPNPALQVDNLGRIGIGTTTPQEAFLHIRTTNGTRLLAQHANENFWSEFATAGVNGSGATIRKWSVGSTGDTRSSALGGPNKFFIYQYSDKNDTTINQFRMVIDSNGNTGIGTITPSEKLEVAGNIKATRFIGNGSGLTNISTSGIKNLSIDSLTDAKADTNSVFLGSGAGDAHSGSTYSTAVGIDALKNNNGSSLYNSAFGYQALMTNNSGDYNTGIGSFSLRSNTTGFWNTASGSYSLYYNTTGSQNTATGFYSLSSNTTGSQNTATGTYSLSSNTTGLDNTASGFKSLYFNTTGGGNTATGEFSLYSNTTGYYNTASGTSSLNSNTTGSYNTALGSHSLWYANNNSSNNTAVGYKAGEGTFSNEFSNGTFLGFEAGTSITTGDNNILIGYRAGDNITSGATNLVIGYDNDAPSATGSNQIDIADTIYGNSSTRNVGIGINNTSSKLTVNGDFALREISSATADSGFGELYVSSVDSELYFDADDANPVRLTNNGSIASSENATRSDPWILVHSENFNSAPSGWNMNTTSTCGNSTILGGFNIISTGQLRKNFNLSAHPHTHVKVKFNYYSLDTWDSETAFVKIDGLTAWSSQKLVWSDPERNHIPNCGTGGFNNNQSDPANKDLILTGEAILDHTDNNLNLTFGSSLNEVPLYESYGIDNLEIWVRSPNLNNTVPVGQSPSNNTGCGPNGFYPAPYPQDVSPNPGNYQAGNGAGPSRVDFTKCNQVIFVDDGHSVTRTWTFVNPPRSGDLLFKIEKRRTGSLGLGISHWFNPPGSPSIRIDIPGANRNADLFVSCYFNSINGTYTCQYNWYPI